MRFIIRSLTIIGAITVISMLAMTALALFGKMTKRVQNNTIVELDLGDSLEEKSPNSIVAQVAQRDHISLKDVIDGIDKAASDERIVGLVAKIGSSNISMAKAQEIRDAIARFRAQKKWSVAYADSFGEFSVANGPYYLATAFDEIYIQPSGEVDLTGVMLAVPFVKGLLDKLGIQYRGATRYEYKNAPNMFTQVDFTPPHKESFSALTTAWAGQIKAGISSSRKIASSEMDALFNNGPYLAADAVKLKLIDGVAYRDEVYDRVKKKAKEGAQLLYLEKYLERAGSPHNSGPKVALIFGVGQVMRGQSQFSLLDAGDSLGAEEVAAAFRAAIEDKDVKAIVFRIDSPGGSYIGSDMVWREVQRAKAAHKPVIASFGTLAASGGYFVAMGANKIVSQPGTLTGSIGVFAGKMVTRGFWEKIGVNWNEVHQGDNATILASSQDFTPEQWKKLNLWLDHVYEDFTSKVAKGRGLPKEKVLEIAKGRIWSGEEAKALGLVDELGGYETAYRLAKAEAKIPQTQSIDVVVFPKEKKVLEKVLKLNEPNNSEEEGAQASLLSSRDIPWNLLTRELAMRTSKDHAALSMQSLFGY